VGVGQGEFARRGADVEHGDAARGGDGDGDGTRDHGRRRESVDHGQTDDQRFEDEKLDADGRTRREVEAGNPAHEVLVDPRVAERGVAVDGVTPPDHASTSRSRSVIAQRTASSNGV